MVEPGTVVGSDDSESEEWLTRNLSSESQVYFKTEAVKILRGGFRQFPRKALELIGKIALGGKQSGNKGTAQLPPIA
jgi:hypothetical protein